jgi:predicted Zn-dependent peptidase
VDEIVEIIDRVTQDDVLRVGRELLQPSRAIIAAVGPFESDAAFAGII